MQFYVSVISQQHCLEKKEISKQNSFPGEFSQRKRIPPEEEIASLSAKFLQKIEQKEARPNLFHEINNNQYQNITKDI